jgi:predicted nucleic acid-binding protein
MRWIGRFGPWSEPDSRGPELAELLAGAPPDRRQDLFLALGSLPWAELDHAAWRQVGEVANDLRRSGASVPLTDVVIAVASTRARARLWTRDRDFERIRRALPTLELRLA